MIRHARSGAALPVSALPVTMIEPAFGGLLMAAVGGAALQPAGTCATGATAINLAALTGRADEEDPAAARRATGALPVRSRTNRRHVGDQVGWTGTTEGGKIQAT